jgi:nucleotide-binding universal stress UspA family protein
MKILLAVDGSGYGEAAAKEVAQHLWEENSEVKIISVVEIPYMPAISHPMSPYWGLPGDYYGVARKAAKDRANAAIENAQKILANAVTKTLNVTTETIEGLPKQAIVEEAESWGADLIVLGSHGYGTWERLLLGSVSQAVSAHAPCSVEIVRNEQVM